MEERIGVLLGRGQYDWQIGANSSIVRDVLLEDGDWKPYQVEHEKQWTGTYDTLFCVTYSALASIGALFMYYFRNNLISADNVKWLQDNGYFKNGFINFNERFSGTLGETTNKGAYQYKVANAIKNYGLIPQDKFPLADNFYDNINPKFITQEMKDLGKEFLKRFSINYEWTEDLKESLKYSPVQVIVKFANYEKPEDILKPEGELNHAVESVLATVEYNLIRDTYWQIYKRYSPPFTHSYMAFKLTINNNNNMDTAKWLKTNDKKWVRNQNTGAFGRVLQGNLMTFTTTDRAALALLDDKVRENGVQITDSEWNQLPKKQF